MRAFSEGCTFYVCYHILFNSNDAILYPTYNQPDNDQKAAQILAQAFPEKDIVGIDCCPLIKQHGSLHCVTMQYPESVKNSKH